MGIPLKETRLLRSALGKAMSLLKCHNLRQKWPTVNHTLIRDKVSHPNPYLPLVSKPDLTKHAAEAGIGNNPNPNPNNQHLGYDGSMSTMPEPSNFFFEGSSDLFQPLLVSSDMFALDNISFMDEPMDMNTAYDPPSMLPVGIPYGARFPSHT